MLLLPFSSFCQTIDEKVDSLLQQMTIVQKVGQMTQVERGALVNMEHLKTYGIGSLLSGGGSAPNPNTISSWVNMYNDFQTKALESELAIPLVYGIDAVHGHNNVYGAVIFPHNIGMGCTWNPELIEQANQIVAKEVSATGIDWTFSPCIAVARNERWGRTYEGFGETAEIQKIMAEASVLGLQGTNLGDNSTILACAKHFVGDGGTEFGIDQGNTILSEDELRGIHMEGYIDAINAGVGTVMASYSSWNGEKLHGHDYLLTDVLKNELGFEGFVISDWSGVDQIDENYRTAIKRAINAGIDMVMVPSQYEVFIAHLLSLVADGEVSQDRIDDAVRRILKQKFLLNLFDEPFANDEFVDAFGSEEHRAVARQVVRESMVLLNAKNDVLPLRKNDQTILVAGPLAADLGAQCGGWTMSWQGGNGSITQGTNILQGLVELSETSNILYDANGNYSGSVDVAVVVIGEKTPYAEGYGDRADLEIDAADINLIKKLKEDGIPTIALLVSGRPMILGELLTYTDAIIPIWYPGTEGDGIAEVLYGDYLPKGKLSHSWAKDMSQIPLNWGDESYDALFSYQHGLTEFPESSAAEKLMPYAATTNKLGNEILLSLSDEITTLNATINDFEIKVNGATVTDLIASINIAEFDESILFFSLNTNVQENNKITISYTGGNIMSNNLTLDSFEDFYVYNATIYSNTTHEIPGRFEAEDYFDMFGIQTEPCTDVGGGENVGYFNPGDWLKYYVEVKETGLYHLNCRMAGFATGSLRIQFDNDFETFVDYSSTNGWQNWQDFTSTIYLNEGFYEMEAYSFTDAININYFDFDLIETSVQNPLQQVENINVFPVPFKESINVEFTLNKALNTSVKLSDITGKFVQELFNEKLSKGRHKLLFSIDPDLANGIYFIEIRDGQKRYFEKLIKED